MCWANQTPTHDPTTGLKPLEAICLRAIARRPEDRYATAAELGQEIERWLDDLPVLAYPNRCYCDQSDGFVRTSDSRNSASAVLFTSVIGLGIFSGFMRSTNLEIERKNSDLITQANAASEVLLDYGEAEFLDGKHSAQSRSTFALGKLRQDGDPMKDELADVLADRLTHGGRSFVVLPHKAPSTALPTALTVPESPPHRATVPPVFGTREAVHPSENHLFTRPQ